MKKYFAISLMIGFVLYLNLNAQIPQNAIPLKLEDAFKMDVISAKVKDFKLDSINLSSPLNNYLSRAWIRYNGKTKYWASISTSKFIFDADAPDETIDDDLRNYVLNEYVDAIIIYRDSVAGVITHTDGEGLFLLNYCWIEDGRWVNGGQGLADNFEDAQKRLYIQLPIHHKNLPRIAQVKALPYDVTQFVDFLSTIDTNPEQFLLEMLGNYKLVINGEYHRRKVSWDCLKRLVSMPEFPEKVGHVFMELPSWCQPQMDAFMSSDTIQTNILLQIFREEQPVGWWDRGEFEFICDLWHLNKSLPSDKRVKIVLADYQVPYSKIKSREELKELEDRNTHMADVIENTILSSKDNRNNLFLVGCAHVYKSRQAGLGSAAYGKESAATAGYQLSERLGTDNVFTVFQHMLSGDNNGNNKSPIRGGVFDRAFEMDGNRPVGFRLADSPFGNEPFDGIYEIKFNIETGTYVDNYDGYLFLHPINNEPKASPLTEIFTDEFVNELKRRAATLGTENHHRIWFGRTAPELTKEYIIKVLQED